MHPLRNALCAAALVGASLCALACSGTPTLREAGPAQIAVLARDEHVPLSRCADLVFFVPDATWGGRLPRTGELSPTSRAIVAASDVVVGIGGGDLARDEMLAAREAGKTVVFLPADMNHQVARAKARDKGVPAPTDFRGAAHAAMRRGS